MIDNLADLNAAVVANVQYDGFGMGTAQIMPCPFCATPGMMRVRVMNAREDMERGGHCDQCGRSIKALFTDMADGSYSFELVLTEGDDPPPWLLPPIRRV
jgi:hypothetical protein